MNRYEALDGILIVCDYDCGYVHNTMLNGHFTHEINDEINLENVKNRYRLYEQYAIHTIIECVDGGITIYNREDDRYEKANP